MEKWLYFFPDRTLNYQEMSIHVLNKYQESVPIAYCIVEEEEFEAKVALKRGLRRVSYLNDSGHKL